MLGSQALDTAVGLVLLLFILATAASTLLELVNRVGQKRTRNLATVLGHLLGGRGGNGADAMAALDALSRTSVYAATIASGREGPAYLSAKSFADATLELASTVGRSGDAVLPAELRERLDLLLQEVGDDALELRAGLERWFDEAMGRLSDAYRRQATLALGAIGFVLAVAANASVPDIASRLWSGSVTRATVVAAAQNAAQGKGVETLSQVASTTDGIAQLSIPLGWGAAGFSGGGAGWWLAHLLGWGLTALLVMVGAPFWFDLLGRLITVRVGGSGGQPPRADQDPAAATPRVLARDGNPAYGDDPAVVGAAQSPLIANVRKAVARSAA